MSAGHSLLYPKVRSAVNTWRDARARHVLPLVFLTLVFWLVIYAVFYRMLTLFLSTEDIGTLLTVKLVSMTLVSFELILVFSNLVCAFTTFFFSEDLYLLVSSPASLHRIYLWRFLETCFHASWMVYLMSVPIFAALGNVFGAGLMFYASLPLVMVPLAMIPTAAGIILALLLVNLFMARRTRDILSFLSVIGLGALVIAFRFLRPEKMLRSHEMESLVSYFSLLRNPDSPLLPHFWAGKVILGTLGLIQTETWFFLLTLFSAALGLLSIGYYMFAALYRRGFSRAQESDTRRINSLGLLEILMGAYLKLFPLRSRHLVLKDLKALVRDKSQWSQLILLAGLIVVYLYNFAVMPLERSPLPPYLLEIIITFLNLGLAGFILASISSRFVFPGVSLEGKSFWLLRSAPVSMENFLWAKMGVLTLPLVILGQFLVYMSSYILKADLPATVLACLVVFTLTLALVGLGTGLGALFPRFEVENPAQIPTGYGGMVYMVTSIGLIGATLLLLARPVHLLLVARLHKVLLTRGESIEILLFTAAIALLHLGVMRLAMHKGCRALEVMEF
ncbi:MAG: hypothetical protein U9P14_06655 [Gemmatimonadota bacterium]|nr:hypothetical protein [Gemmatimonadota bacterium]